MERYVVFVISMRREEGICENMILLRDLVRCSIFSSASWSPHLKSFAAGCA